VTVSLDLCESLPLYDEAKSCKPNQHVISLCCEPVNKKRCTELSKTKGDVQSKAKLITSKVFFVLPLSWLTDAERASSLIHDAVSPAFSGLQKTNER
jgi:hypothetical protein